MQESFNIIRRLKITYPSILIRNEGEENDNLVKELESRSYFRPKSARKLLFSSSCGTL
ncbi:hypothetical protein Pla144_50280 [Bythopirellula polymerisocia]|uniref:Uncharacterized protein n=1 Tax=Bythopirellula polymerisocia TaxID=2528003 RepID=A0A5C6C7K1_9BACT|nr:hypothetical protein Pla144_50280 [Bythopirellula polymerisocia]